VIAPCAAGEGWILEREGGGSGVVVDGHRVEGRAVLRRGRRLDHSSPGKPHEHFARRGQCFKIGPSFSDVALDGSTQARVGMRRRHGSGVHTPARESGDS